MGRLDVLRCVPTPVIAQQFHICRMHFQTACFPVLFHRLTFHLSLLPPLLPSSVLVYNPGRPSTFDPSTVASSVRMTVVCHYTLLRINFICLTVFCL